MSNMRNTSSYLKIQYNRVQQSNLLNDLLQTYDTSISDEPRYARYKNMMVYHDIEYLTQIIQQNEAFLCLYDSTIMTVGPPALFCLVKNEFKGYYKIYIVCNDDDGTHKCGQWYSVVNIDPFDVEHDQYNWCDNVIKNYVNILALHLVKPVDGDNNLYAFITDTWLCQNQHGLMCLPTMSTSLLNKYSV